MSKKSKRAVDAFKRLFADKIDNLETILDSVCSTDENGNIVFDDHDVWMSFEDWGSEAVDTFANPQTIAMANEEVADDVRLAMSLPGVDHSTKMFLARVYREQITHLDDEITSCRLADRPRDWVKPNDWWC